ncbi:DGQHR domain-containing protein [Psychrosphaera haliotis]|uniref:DGQHR domain-containing protein n=2 Tax=Psychrosphaera haliotis TaxID=555083 RepID=A0A6N8FDB6_9GAMM|nr:DGQHR domain-containing protein [Psychrosphaera haliotis]
MFSDDLAKCSFVSTRDEDPEFGFQRALDESRAQQIADYIDNENGSIPTAIILSAQEAAKFEVVSKGKAVEFILDPKAFLILDGQHRVFGFSKAKSRLRVPVIIYSGLSRRDESRLFIDINSKQKGVPTELLLDIKRLAEYESSTEQLLRDIFDHFNKDPRSSLYGKLSPAVKSKSKISRVTFNSAVTPVAKIFGDRDSDELFEILNSYLRVFVGNYLKKNNYEEGVVSSIVFKAVLNVFPEIASKVKDRYGSEYSADNFLSVMLDMFEAIDINKIKKPGKSYLALSKHFSESMKTNFTL